MGEPIQRSTSANARVGERYVSRVIRFEFLAPNIVEQIAGDHQPPDFKRRRPRQTARWVFELGAMKSSFGPARSKSTANIRNGEKFPNCSEICQTSLSPVAFQSPKRYTRRGF